MIFSSILVKFFEELFKYKDYCSGVMEYDPKKLHYIVVTGIIVRNGKYLITKRAEWEKAFPNKWTVPGGKLETDDYLNRDKDTKEHWYNVFEDLLRREVKEEVSLEIENMGYVTSMVYMRPDGIPCIIVSLFADSKSGEIELCNALTEYAWVDLEQAKNYDLIEGIYDELIILDNFIKTGKSMVWDSVKE
jgi:8-oxo-dGTP diphosphatase